MRREALDAIGGFPIGSLAEDVCCSSMLLGSGWNTAFVHEPLQFGTVPDSFSSHLKQRTRWVSKLRLFAASADWSIDHWYCPDIVEAAIQSLWPFGWSYDFCATYLRLRVHDLIPIHYLSGRVDVHGAARPSLARQSGPLLQSQPAQVANSDLLGVSGTKPCQ